MSHVLKPQPKTRKDTGIISRLFKLQNFKTSILLEAKAGGVTFLAMGYVVILIPSLLQRGGILFSVALSTTILMIVIATLTMALLTNRPFVLAPAVGSTAIFSFTLLGSGIPLSVASGIIFISGALFLGTSLLGGREFIERVVPNGIKISIATGVGLFIALWGLKQVGIIVVNIRETALVFGDITAPNALLAIGGFFLLLTFLTRRSFYGPLFSLVIITLVGIPLGITTLPEQIFAMPSSVASMFGNVDLYGALDVVYLPYYLTFFMSDFFSSAASMRGVAKAMHTKGKDIDNINLAFDIDSAATVLGGLFSSPIVTTYQESVEGVKRGGRTGLSSIFCVGLFACTLFITPLLDMVPTEATAPLLIILGISTLSGLKYLNYDDIADYLPAFVCIAITIFSFNGGNVGNGIAAAILIYTFIKVVTFRFHEDGIFIYLLVPIVLYYFYAEAVLY